MDPAYIGAFSALAGSIIGGLTSLATSWLTQSTQARAEELRRNRSRRDLVEWVGNKSSPYGTITQRATRIRYRIMYAIGAERKYLHVRLPLAIWAISGKPMLVASLSHARPRRKLGGQRLSHFVRGSRPR
jgi:hypothetical protein